MNDLVWKFGVQVKVELILVKCDSTCDRNIEITFGMFEVSNLG